MIEILQDLPLGVVGFRAHGMVTAADYQDVLAPAIEGALVNQPKLRLLYEMAPDFEGYEVGAMWEDTKLGISHPFSWKRIAVVSDTKWLNLTMRSLGWIVPCPFRVYTRDRLDEARTWLADPGTSGLIATLEAERAILTLEPHGKLEKEDFEQLAKQVDPFLEEHGDLNGVLIRADAFPGWDGLGAMFAHLKFVREHQKHIKHLAVVTDDKMLAHLPAFAKVFVSAEVKHFPVAEEEAARDWMLAKSAEKIG